MYRQKYCKTALDALSDAHKKRPADTGIATVLPADLPEPCTHFEVTYEIFTADDPDDTQFEAHAEVRVRRATDAPKRECVTPKSPTVKLLLKKAIALKMKVEIDPSIGLSQLLSLVVPAASDAVAVEAPVSADGSSSTNDDATTPTPLRGDGKEESPVPGAAVLPGATLSPPSE